MMLIKIIVSVKDMFMMVLILMMSMAMMTKYVARVMEIFLMVSFVIDLYCL